MYGATDSGRECGLWQCVQRHLIVAMYCRGATRKATVKGWLSNFRIDTCDLCVQESMDVESAAAAKAALMSAAAEVSSLLAQVSASEAENEQLRKDLEAARMRESSLQTLLDGQKPGDQLVAFDVHMGVVHENKELRDQIEQLKRDLEVMYMDNNFMTGAGGGGSEVLAGPGGQQSHMNTSTRLASLLAPSEMSQFNLAVRLSCLCLHLAARLRAFHKRSELVASENSPGCASAACVVAVVSLGGFSLPLFLLPAYLRLALVQKSFMGGRSGKLPPLGGGGSLVPSGRNSVSPLMSPVSTMLPGAASIPLPSSASASPPVGASASPCSLHCVSLAL